MTQGIPILTRWWAEPSHMVADCSGWRVGVEVVVGGQEVLGLISAYQWVESNPRVSRILVGHKGVYGSWPRWR